MEKEEEQLGNSEKGPSLSFLGRSSFLLADLSTQKPLSPASSPQHLPGDSRQSLEVTPRTNAFGPPSGT